MSGGKKPDLVIFDCDGVLIDSQVIQCRIDAAELTRLGFPVTADELARKFIGTSTKDIQTHVELALGVGFRTTLKPRVTAWWMLPTELNYRPWQA